MIDVILNLLIFFMLISRYLPPSLNVALPQAASASVDSRPGIAISIDLRGKLAVDGNDEPWEALPALLKGRDPETQVRISADRSADYDYVVRAMDAAGKAGLVHIALETAPAKDGAPAAENIPPADDSQPVMQPNVDYD
jgi:biopolymer transport protein ExbD